MITSDLNSVILANINDLTQPIWLPKLTPVLVARKWATLEQSGITPEHYTSDKVSHSQETSNYLSQERVTDIPIYGISKPLFQDGLKASSYKPEELTSNEVISCLSEAFKAISVIPTMLSTILLLVKSIHLIKPEDDGYDISYSLPNVPFSIFISVPSVRVKHDTLRVAEAILHEAMHLQLTLIDEIRPLINSVANSTFFSPWKQEFRHPLGLLHAIYVFKNIKDFLITLPQDDLEAAHIKSRVIEIDSQMLSTNSFKQYDGLTTTGKALTHRLFETK